jgi:hypothetical protein
MTISDREIPEAFSDQYTTGELRNTKFGLIEFPAGLHNSWLLGHVFHN